MRSGSFLDYGGKPSPLGRRWRRTRRMRGKCPEVIPSSVTCGDSFPQRGKPYMRFTRTFCVVVLLRAGHTPPLLCIIKNVSAQADTPYLNSEL